MIPMNEWLALNSRIMPKMFKSEKMCAAVLYGACRMRDLFRRELEESESLRRELIQERERCRQFASLWADEYREGNRLHDLILRAGLWKTAPCCLCGYNGPGYYQPETHDCAGLAAEKEKP